MVQGMHVNTEPPRNLPLQDGRKHPNLWQRMQEMPQQQSKPANLNLKITQDERWDFKEFCVSHRMSQVDGFRLAFKLMKEHFEAEGK
jgi:hypothetical protein